jgi:undecaprenyl-diphosphatase|tara:strand:+ start:80 stop:1525 length:1446 start_codon:yes stop_codon:yes gene_type:complete
VKNKNFFLYSAIALSIILFLIRVVFISNTLLVDDEAYYAMYARHLSWGYIDHGPVVAFIIWFFTLVHESSFTVRIGSVFLMTLTSFIVFYYGKYLVTFKTALAMSVLVSANLLFHTNSIIITPDAPLAFFTINAIIFYYLAYFKNEKFIYIGGIMIGLAVLSKVSALFPAIGIFLFPFLAKDMRHWIRNIHFYGSFILSFIIFLPFVIWNLQNEFAFVKYQGSHILEGGGLSDFIELWLGVALLIGPLYFFHSTIKPFLHISNWKNITHEKKYFTLVTIFPLIYFITQSAFSRLELNWVAPIFSGGLFLVGLELNSQKKISRGFKFQIGYSLLLIGLIMIQTFYPILPLKGKSDPTNRYYMYSNLINDTKKMLKEKPALAKLRIVSNEFQIPSMINFYLNPNYEAICLSIDYHETLYSFLHKQSDLIGDDFIYIHDKKVFPEKLKAYFDSYDLIQTTEELRNDSTVSIYSIWLVKNYNGRN